MLSAVILICSLALTPDLAACTRDNAVDVLLVPGSYGVPAACFMHAQAFLAGTSIGRELTADEHVKVTCEPTRRAAR